MKLCGWSRQLFALSHLAQYIDGLNKGFFTEEFDPTVLVFQDLKTDFKGPFTSFSSISSCVAESTTEIEEYRSRKFKELAAVCA